MPKTKSSRNTTSRRKGQEQNLANNTIEPVMSNNNASEAAPRKKSMSLPQKSNCYCRPLSTRATRFLVLLNIIFLPKLLSAVSIGCTSDVNCTLYYREGSTCLEGKCTNPYASGCLRKLLGKERYPSKRVCNSDDDTGTYCESSKFNYMEVRVANQNWESAMFLSWIIQILLSEVLDVPTTIETGSVNRSFSFYDIYNSFDYATLGYDFDAIKRADKVKDCRASDKTSSCAHVIPELWNGYQKELNKSEMKKVIAPVGGNGEIGKTSWYIPKFTADFNASLLTYYGLRNERETLANTFKRPTTWIDYCAEVSSTNCSNDSTASRYPANPREASMYFAKDLYRGHFRNTDDNNCAINPTSCTGHIIDAQCNLSTFIQPQLYWNNISLESNGPFKPNGGYSYGQMIQIWKAANATKEHIISWWRKPDPTIELFRGTDAEFQSIKLPEPTQECVKARVSSEERCSSDPIVRYGGSLGSCDSETHAPMNLIASSLYKMTTNTVSEAERSPAYETIKQLRITDLEMETIFKAWVEKEGVDKYGYDAREAVCSWVADHIQQLQRYVPEGFPRTIVEDEYTGWVFSFAQAIGGMTFLCVVVSMILVWNWRAKKVMRFSQIQFLFMILAGFSLLSIGSIVRTIEPSLGSCTSAQWLVTIGYNLSLVPLLVKIAAIHTLLRKASEMKRVTINPKTLLMVVGITLGLVILFLIAWTTIDPPTKNVDVYVEGSVVKIMPECSSSSDAWKIVDLAWEFVLLGCAAVLAFLVRNDVQEFNESASLAIMTYTHVMFLVLRLIVYLVESMLPSDIAAGVTSLLLSFDTILSIIIYFWPKFLAAASPEKQANDYSSKASRSLYETRVSGFDRWHRAPLPPDEEERLMVLHETGILDTDPQERFDRITRIATNLFDVPIVLVSLVDRNRQWFKSRQGLCATSTHRDQAFCSHAILKDEIFVIPNATRDDRFAENPLVTGEPCIRFYAGCPIKIRKMRLGTLCLIDRKPRELDETQLQMLKDLGALVEQEFALLGNTK